MSLIARAYPNPETTLPVGVRVRGWDSRNINRLRLLLFNTMSSAVIGYYPSRQIYKFPSTAPVRPVFLWSEYLF